MLVMPLTIYKYIVLYIINTLLLHYFLPNEYLMNIYIYIV